MSGTLGTCLSNLKSVTLAFLELFAFNAQKFMKSCESGHAPFYPHSTFRRWRPPRHVSWTIHHYNQPINDIREALPISHWKCIMWVPIWGKIINGKIGDTLIGFWPPNERVLSIPVPDVCAKFRQNGLRIATVRARTDTHRDIVTHTHTHRDHTGDLIMSLSML